MSKFEIFNSEGENCIFFEISKLFAWQTYIWSTALSSACLHINLSSAGISIRHSDSTHKSSHSLWIKINFLFARTASESIFMTLSASLLQPYRWRTFSIIIIFRIMAHLVACLLAEHKIDSSEAKTNFFLSSN